MPFDTIEDGDGNLYIEGSCRIGKLSPKTGIVTTIAGDGSEGSAGDGGLAIKAQICPYDFIRDHDGWGFSQNRPEIILGRREAKNKAIWA